MSKEESKKGALRRFFSKIKRAIVGGKDKDPIKRSSKDIKTVYASLLK